jgi:hypothetical protein
MCQFGGQIIPMMIKQRLLGRVLEGEEKLRGLVAEILYLAGVQFEDALSKQRRFVLDQEIVEWAVVM